MEVIQERILQSDSVRLPELFRLYLETFPVVERRRLEQLSYLIDNEPSFYFNALSYNKEPAGFFIYWDLDGSYYYEYLAVFEHMRNKKIGSQVLHHAQEYLKGFRFFEVEPPNIEINARRIAYYERHGYQVLCTDFVQAPYDLLGDQEEPYVLWIMGNKHLPQLSEILATMVQRVYTDTYGVP